MASEILERVAKQPDSGTGTMPIVYPPGVHNVYVHMPAGVFDLVVTWPGRAQVEVTHMPDRTWATAQTVLNFPAQSAVRERRALYRIASENPQQVFFRSSGVVDANVRLAAQVIPATPTFEA